MKLFPLNNGKGRQILALVKCFFFLLLFNACATHEAQYGREAGRDNTLGAPGSALKYTFYLAGDAGNSEEQNSKITLSYLKNKLDNASAQSTLLFLGDNIYPAGMPAQEAKGRKLAEEKLDNQIALAENFKGKTIFIPGNHDWYNEGVTGLKRQEDYVNSKLKQKKAFLPKNGCAIDEVKINDELSLVTVDSQWYLENWNDNPTINDNCDIKNREDFFAELENILNKNQKRTVILAMHHPLVSNGTHGGQFSLLKNIFPFESNFPLPGIASAINFLRKTSGLSPQDMQNKKYTALVKRIKAIIGEHQNVIVVSGHEHNIQYVERDNVKQIVSGAGSKAEAARAISPKDFSYGGSGYAVLQVFDKGESWVSFYGIKNKKEQLLHKYKVSQPVLEKEIKTYPVPTDKKFDSSVYNDSLMHKSAFHNFLWGTHYRSYYGKLINANVANLDTLYGGLKPEIAGGGHQSFSLRLKDKSGKEYVMRALKKSAVRFIQAVAFKDQSIANDFKNTYAEDFLLDFYTTSHPYTPFVVGDLAGSVGVNHSNPKLFYVPKQNALREFNEGFGGELYMIEERPSEGFESLASFGKPDAIVGTDDVLQNLNKDEKYKIDEKAYIRARLFDMLIGDWDRHYDQWRWGEYKENGTIIYRPIPRDRDQAFSKYDGKLLHLLMKMPALRHMQSFKDDISNVKWFNMEPYPLDLALIRYSDKKVWEEQADYIKNNLTDKEIDKAFLNLPKEVQDATMDGIKKNLKSRRSKMNEYADDYYEVLQKTVLIVGTDKKNRFSIQRLADGKTEVKVYRIKKEGDEILISDRTYNKKETSELWIYGLDDDDVFEVKGKGSNPIKIRLLGGQDNDSYTVENGKKVKIYDFKSKADQFKLDARTKAVLSDDYQLNLYDYKRPKYNAIAGYPNIGFNPDDGVKLGVSVTYTVNGFKRNPFSQRHNIKANYYFATGGYELLYKGIFPNILNNWQFQVDAGITSPNFSYNFFGYGNETVNKDDELSMDYNRVKTQVMRAAPSMNWKGELGAFFTAQATFESVEVEKSMDRIIGTGIVNDRVFRTQNFAGLNLKYGYENYDNVSNPTLGMKFSVEAGYKVNLAQPKREVPHVETIFGFSHKILSNGKLVFGSLAKAKFIFSDDYEFYQMATIGGDFDIRAYRSERFSGKQSFFQSSDLRLELGKVRNSIVPLRYGMLGGFDYGRVWLPNENSDKWHTSYGGGLWLNGANVITAKLSYFYSSEGGRVSFGLGFGF